MNTEKLRDYLKQKIDEANDAELHQIQQILNEPEAPSYVLPEVDNEEMPELLQKLLKQGIKELDEGKGIPHDEVMKRMREKYPALKK